MNNERNIENLYSALNKFVTDIIEDVNDIFDKNIQYDCTQLDKKIIVKVEYNNSGIDKYYATYEFTLNSDNELIMTTIV